jgi:hypothetical protein
VHSLPRLSFFPSFRNLADHYITFTYSANISARISNTSFCITGSMNPCFFIKGDLSTVQI